MLCCPWVKESFGTGRKKPSRSPVGQDFAQAKSDCRGETGGLSSVILLFAEERAAWRGVPVRQLLSRGYAYTPLNTFWAGPVI